MPPCKRIYANSSAGIFKEEEVLAHGEHITDTWLILGQALEDIERGRAQRTWLLGTTTRRSALLLQFSFAGVPFSVHYQLGSCQKAELVYWPSVQPQRALIAARQGEMEQFPEHLPGVKRSAFLDDVANTLARLPWRDRFLCTLCQVTPVSMMQQAIAGTSVISMGKRFPSSKANTGNC